MNIPIDNVSPRAANVASFVAMTRASLSIIRRVPEILRSGRPGIPLEARQRRRVSGRSEHEVTAFCDIKSNQRNFVRTVITIGYAGVSWNQRLGAARMDGVRYTCKTDHELGTSESLGMEACETDPLWPIF